MVISYIADYKETLYQSTLLISVLTTAYPANRACRYVPL